MGMSVRPMQVRQEFKYCPTVDKLVSMDNASPTDLSGAVPPSLQNYVAQTVPSLMVKENRRQTQRNASESATVLWVPLHGPVPMLKAR
jgi:hypothetical protein